MVDVEIVTHCWRYARALNWQIDSLLEWYWSKQDIRVVLTVVTSRDDHETESLIDSYEHNGQVPFNVLYQDRPQLFNRNIGRNIVAKRTNARWVWFADADYHFGPACFRELASLNPGDYTLCFPQEVRVTRNHSIGDGLLQHGPMAGCMPLDHKQKRLGKAIGGCQIVPGRIARENGYCDWPKAQQPVEGDSMADTRGDRSFRVSLGTPGTPIDLSDVYRIRHSTSGLARSVGGRDRWTGN